MKKYFLFCMICCSLFFCGCGDKSYLEENGGLELESEEISKEDDEASSDTIFVQVAGAVKSPGVYELPKDARVFQAIFFAGGFLEDADESGLNQASLLSDGQKIYVYSKGEAEKEAARAEEDGLININNATESELMTLPGIGQAKASQIVAYRNANGPFSSKEDIMKIQGIKEGVYAKISELIVAK